MKLLFNYLPFSMKESDPVARSPKKAKGAANNSIISKLKSTPTKLSGSNGHNGNIKSSNGTSPAKKSSKISPIIKIKKKKKLIKEAVEVGKKSKRKIDSNSVDSNSNSSGSSVAPRKSHKKGNNKSSPELRPRRRASQTYLVKYQLARNPLKAEEEDLKLALLASLEQCGEAKNGVDLDQINATTNNILDRSSQSKETAQKQKYQSQNSNNHHQHTSLNSHHKQPQTEALTTRAPPTKYDEEYLKRYRPETEDFLTFICFRITAPQNQNRSDIESTANGKEGAANDAANNYSTNNITGTKSNEKSTSNDSQYLKRSSSPCKTVNNASNSPNHHSPSNRRRPTRQSPRLASSSRKISEFDSLNAAYDNFINYEEDVKRASIALEDMAQEINGKDELQNNRVAQSSSEHQVTAKLSPYKNNKHLVKGLMTREFAGAFADEEIIFESISNHKL